MRTFMITNRKTLRQAMSKWTTSTFMVSVLIWNTGCAMLSRGEADGEPAVNSDPSQAVVIQVGQADPVVSKHDRRYWLDLRQGKSLIPRLKGALATGEADAVVSLAKARLAKAPGDPEALTALTLALSLTRNYDLAAYYAAQLERVRPGSALARNVEAMAIVMTAKPRLADYRRAEALFDRAFHGDAGQIAPGLNLGNLQLELGNAIAATKTFSEVVERCGRCTVGLMGLGMAAARSQQPEAAVAAFEEVLKKNANHAGALYNLALVYRNSYNDNKQAEKYLMTLVRQAKTPNLALKEKAQVVLRMIKGEASNDERRQMVDDGDKTRDAEALMRATEQDQGAPGQAE